MNQYIRYSIALLGLVALGAWLSRHYGWYNSYWFVDITLHIVSGIMFGLFWLGIHSRSEFGSKWSLFISTIAFATFGSVLWEFWEFEGWKIMPAHTQFYFPILSDTLGDIASGMFGGLLLACAKIF